MSHSLAGRVGWFGGATGHRDEPPTWLLVDARDAVPGHRRRAAHLGGRLLRRG